MKTRWMLLFSVFVIVPEVMSAADEPMPTVLKLVPAAEPVPLFKYRLLPELRDQTPGNAVTAYYRAFSPEWQGYRRELKWQESLEAAMEMSLDKLRGSEEAKKLEWTRTSAMLKEVERAARRSFCDWELTDRIRDDGIGLLLPDLQSFREFARLLAMKARLEMADGNFDAAARTLQTGYALARHAGEGPTLIHGLVGIALASVMNKQLETWVQTPGSPNLYWALTDLPAPFIDLRKCMQGERIMIDNLFPNMRDCLKDKNHQPLSQAEMREASDRMFGIIGGDSSERGAFPLIVAAAKYGSSKKFLSEHGWTTAQIEAMPVLQVVFMQELFEYDRLFDIMTRGMNLPYLPGQKLLKDGDDQLKREVAGPVLSVPLVARLMLPAISRVSIARVRLDRQIAALRTLEAVRMYAADHDGNMPASLAAIAAVPIPNDPVTGLPFEYTLNGDTAMLIGKPITGESLNNAIRFKISLAK